MRPGFGDVVRPHHALLPSVPHAHKFGSNVRIGGRVGVLASGDPMDTGEQFHTIGRLKALAEPDYPFDTGNSVGITGQDAVRLVAHTGEQLIR